MNPHVPVHSTVQARPVCDDEVRPVLAAMIGALGERRAVIPRVVDALGEGLVVLSIPRKLRRDEVRLAYQRVGEHLAGGGPVLVNAVNTAKSERRALLDVAARHWASTLAVVCAGARPETGLLAELPAEGWHAVVVTVTASVSGRAR
jgi:hypothetical protein